jgi:L-iditol 2-dehydrogenase
MRVAVCYGKEDIRIEEREIQKPGPEEVLVKIAYCGICPSDRRVYKGLSSMKLPVVLGHEFVGRVEAVGKQVSGLEIGSRVAVDPVQRCHTLKCQACQKGYNNKCVAMATAFNGFAEYHLTRAANVFPLKETTDLLAATMTEPLACVLHGQKKARVEAGSVVLIVGAGPIGLLHLQAAKFAGSSVIVSDISPGRLETALGFGADHVVNPGEEDLEKVVSEASGSWGADAVIVAASVSRAIEESAQLLAVDGTIVLFAGVRSQTQIMLDPNLIHYREINITGSSDYTDVDFVKALRFIEGGYIDTKKLITDILPLENLKQGMELMATGDRLKVLIKVGEI